VARRDPSLGEARAKIARPSDDADNWPERVRHASSADK
jgi:hypothetical protein